MLFGISGAIRAECFLKVTGAGLHFTETSAQRGLISLGERNSTLHKSHSIQYLSQSLILFSKNCRSVELRATLRACAKCSRATSDWPRCSSQFSQRRFMEGILGKAPGIGNCPQLMKSVFRTISLPNSYGAIKCNNRGWSDAHQGVVK